MVEHVHPDAVCLARCHGESGLLVLRNLGPFLRPVGAVDRCEEEATRSKNAMKFQQPGCPQVGDVREDRNRPDQIEGIALEWQRRGFLVLKHVERRAQVLFEPADARPVDVAAVELSDSRLRYEVPERAPGATAEIENPLPGERPVLRQTFDDLEPRSPADFVECSTSADAIGELERRKGNGASHLEGQCAWAIVDSNHGPPPYQSGALTN